MAESGTTLESPAAAQQRLGAARAGALPLKPGRTGPALYGALFVIVLPLALAGWAAAAHGLERLPRLQSATAGLALLLAGLALWTAGVTALLRRGGGLPMNAYPPPIHVTTGVYAWLRHPIYCGFALATAGVVLMSGSRAGLWLVLPVLVLASCALVVGYEGPALRRRFGTELPRPRLSLPPADPAPASWSDRLSVYSFVLLPWVLAWSTVQLVGVPRDAFSLALPVDERLPVWPGTWFVYATSYLVTPLLPLLLSTRAELRRLSIVALLATATVLLIWLTLPVVYPPRAFAVESLAGRLLAADRTWCTGMASFPAFHVLWALIAAGALARRWARARWWCYGWAVLVTLSCVTTGMHGVLDLLAALLLYPLFANYAAVWESVRAATERVANSWREWRFGGMRVISHGVWAGLGGAAGAASMLLLGPGESRGTALLVAAGGLLGAGIWAQLLESSSGLLRPFGYYGAVFGAVAAAVLAGALGEDAVLLLAALALGAPWVQLLGRIRCLIQGCCHGHATSAALGIRYTHPRSRVSYLAGMAGTPLHATPLYSMAANAVTGIILARLWALAAPQSLIIGVYLIANGLARFVEEGFRGEPQTAVIRGLRIYQWLAIAFVLAGAAVTTVASAPAPAAPTAGGWSTWLWVAGFGLLTGAAMGVDFPASNKRFSRLAGS